MKSTGNNKEVNQTNEKIYSKKTLAMSCGRTASVLYLTGLTTPYTTLFLTTMVGIPAAIYGNINLINTIIGVIMIPIVGFILQRLELPFGKARSFQYLSGLLASVFIVLLFTDFGMENGMAKYILYGVILVCMHTFYNPASSASYVLFSMMTTTPQERANASSVQVQVANIVKLVLNMIMVPLIVALGKMAHSEELGYTLYAIIIAIAIWLLFVIFATAGKPYDPSRKDLAAGVKPIGNAGPAKKSTASVGEMIRSFFTIAPVSIVGSKLLRDMAYFCVAGLVSFYYLYVANSPAMLAVYFSISAFAALAGSFVAPILTKKFTPKAVYIAGSAIYLVAVLAAYFIGKNAYVFTCLLCIVQIGYGIASSLETGLYADAVDYTILKRGSDVRPFLMTCLTIPGKISSMLSPAILGFALAAIQFNKENVTPAMAEGIRVLLSLMPGALLILCLILSVFYPVTQEKLNALKKENAKAQ